MQYRWWMLLCFVICAVAVIAGLRRESPTVPELRRDVKIPSRFPIWILHESAYGRVIAVTRRQKRYKLFVAYRESRDDRRRREWSIPSWVGSGAPLGEPEAKFEASFEFDHYPTDQEIEEFCRDHGVEDYP